MKKLLLLLSIILAPLAAVAQEPYAVYTSETVDGKEVGTLTFYYDAEKESRGGMSVEQDTRGWEEYSWNITNVIFHESFANCTSITSTSKWFNEFFFLTTISGMEYLNTENVTNMEQMFCLCVNLKSLDVSHFDTRNVTNMSNMFEGCSGLTTLDVSHFDTRNVKDMNDMFSSSGLTSLDLSHFDTSNVTDMDGMFRGCFDLKSLDISHFDTENVTDMYGMFAFCSSLTSLDVRHFNTEKVTRMDEMFCRCSSITSLDVSNFDTGNVTDMRSMFSDCSSLTSLDVSNFDTGNVTNMKSMFWNCSGLTSLDVSNFDTGNVTNMGGMFSGCSSLTSLDLSNFDTENVTTMNSMFMRCKSLTSLDVSHFDTGNVTDMVEMFNGCSNLATIYAGESWSTASLTNGSDMFTDCTKLVGNNETVYDANHTDYTYARIDKKDEPGYFTYKKSTIIKPYAILSEDNTTLTFYFDEQKATRGGMGVGKFSDYSKRGWNDNASFITTVVFDASFANCTTLTSTAYWFYNCTNLTTITGIENLKTGKVKNMNGMFSSCSSLTSLDVSHFDTGKVTGMWDMFSGCSSLTSLDLSHFNTGKVTDMWSMFSGCSSLTSLDLSHFDTRNVWRMIYMFSDCSKLTSLLLPENISNIGDCAFDGCNNLAEVFCLACDVPTVGGQNFTPSKVTLYVPSGRKVAYADANFWKKFKEIVELEYYADVDYEVEEGWNWLSSSYVGTKPRSSKSFISIIEDIMIRLVSQTSELVNDPEYGLVGNLTTLNPASGYKLVVDGVTTFKQIYYPFDLNTTVPLYKGWTWLGYIPTTTLPVVTALANLAATEGDRLLCEDEFTEFKNGAWTGDLEVMEPGKGYIYHRMGEDVTFSYSDGSAASRAANVGAGSVSARAASVGADPVSARIAVAKALENRAVRKAALQQAPWQYNSHRYPDNTTIIAQIAETDYHGANPYIIGAFCGDECRGIGKMVDGRIFLTVHGTIGTREPIRFLAYELTTGETLDISEHIAFEGQCLGTLDNPVQLHVVGTADGINGIIAGSKAFDVYTVSGQLVRSQATSLQDLAPGVYVVGGRKVLVK